MPFLEQHRGMGLGARDAVGSMTLENTPLYSSFGGVLFSPPKMAKESGPASPDPTREGGEFDLINWPSTWESRRGLTSLLRDKPNSGLAASVPLLPSTSRAFCSTHYTPGVPAPPQSPQHHPAQQLPVSGGALEQRPSQGLTPQLWCAISLGPWGPGGEAPFRHWEDETEQQEPSALGLSQEPLKDSSKRTRTAVC